MTQEQAEKIKEIVKGYIEILLLYLQKKKGFTEDQILSIVKAIVEENRDLNFSDSDFEKINFSFPDIEYGGNKINWDESIKTSLEKLGLEAINLFKGKEK
jgi:allophanate hydrolase subunit 1